MATSPWVAIDATASSSPRTIDFRQICHDCLRAGRDARVWLPTAESWRRSLIAGIDLCSPRIVTTDAEGLLLGRTMCERHARAAIFDQFLANAFHSTDVR